MSTLTFRDIAKHDPPPVRPYLSQMIKVSSKTYIVWADGIIWNVSDSKYVKQDIDKDGYCICSIGNHTTKVHRLILMVFDRPPEYGEQARHLNGDPSFNDISNLLWGTGKENWQDRREHGRACKLLIEDVKAIRSSLLTNAELAKIYNVSEANISNIKRKIIWRSI